MTKTINNKKKIIYYLLTTLAIVLINYYTVKLGIRSSYIMLGIIYEVVKIVMIYIMYRLLNKDIVNMSSYLFVAYACLVHSVSLIGSEFNIGLDKRSLIFPIVYLFVTFTLFNLSRKREVHTAID